MIGVFIFTAIVSTQSDGIESELFRYVAVGSSVLGIVSFIQNHLNKIKRNEEIIEEEIISAVSPLITILQVSKNFTEKQIDWITTQIEGNLENDRKLISMILLIVSRFCNLIKVEGKDHIPYALALTYKLVEANKTREGRSQKQINNAVTISKRIFCGSKLWKITNDEIIHYHKFTALENLIMLDYEQAKEKAITVDANQAGEDKKINLEESGVIYGILKDNEGKLKKILSIIHDDIPESDFLKILASLETDIVIISEQGTSNPEERKPSGNAPSGKQFVDEVLEKRGLKLGKLNHGVPFAFLHDITEGKNPIFFDLKAWGNQIEKEANTLRKEAGAEERKFNFALLRTPIHELHAFGDDLGEKSRIKIDDNTLARLNSQDVTISTLATIGQILRENKKTSLYEFIDKNIRYLDGITSKEMAQSISEYFCKKHDKKEWQISDFVNYAVTKQDFEGLSITSEQIDKILSETKIIHEIIR